MNPILRNVLAVIAGIVVGSLVNMGIIMLGPAVIPLPDGVDPSDMESLKANMHLFKVHHFIMPFLAHALGTLVGAWLAAMLGASHKMKLALGIGGWFLLGGIVNSFMLPAPVGFILVDLIGAYIPMGWLGGKLGNRVKAE